ncbi:Mu transposase domain-containing protein [Streptomyces griseoloalbus]|uniref:Mu transposase domain-containing protein n=1 Tax=Streptomyces griseoloalbus TaxID=67303 RepID=UPI003F541906
MEPDDIPVRPFPAELEVERTVSPQSLVAFDGNLYSVPPGLPGVQVKVLHRLGEDDLRIVTADRAVVACHRRAPRGAGQTVRDDGHVIALERAVSSSFSDRAPCKTKVRKPPSAAALAEAERLREGPAAGSSAERVVIDLTHYAAVADRLRSVPSPKQEERRNRNHLSDSSWSAWVTVSSASTPASCCARRWRSAGSMAGALASSSRTCQYCVSRSVLEGPRQPLSARRRRDGGVRSPPQSAGADGRGGRKALRSASSQSMNSRMRSAMKSAMASRRVM